MRWTAKKTSQKTYAAGTDHRFDVTAPDGLTFATSVRAPRGSSPGMAELKRRAVAQVRSYYAPRTVA